MAKLKGTFFNPLEHTVNACKIIKFNQGKEIFLLVEFLGRSEVG
jgi:hypothetical protein